MYYINVEELIEHLQKLPKGTKITSIGRGYVGFKQYLTVDGENNKLLLQIDLTRIGNGRVFGDKGLSYDSQDS